MRTRWFVNLGLLAAIGVLCILVLYDEPERERLRVSDIEPSSVLRVRFQPSRAPALELRRHRDGWQLVAPLELPANAIRVESLLAVAAAESLDGFRAAGNDLEQFGLSPPRARLELGSAVFEFGDTDPLDGRRYVFHDGQVHLVVDTFFQHLGASAASYVHPAPLGPGAEPVSIALATQRLYLKDGTWALEPASSEHGPDQLGELAARWQAAQAVSVEPLLRELPWQTQVQVVIRGRAEPIDFLVLAREHDVVLGRLDAGVQYRLVRSSGERLLALPPAPAGS